MSKDKSGKPEARGNNHVSHANTSVKYKQKNDSSMRVSNHRMHTTVDHSQKSKGTRMLNMSAGSHQT